jgi:hypothetical protein
MICSWQHRCLHMTRDTRDVLLSYYCGVGVTLTFNFCRAFCAINMDASLVIFTKEKQVAVIRFYELTMYQVPKCIAGCQCSMGTLSCSSRLSAN